MVSSWYGPGFEGTTTASGEIYRPMRAADHPSLLFGTKLLVSYGERQTIVGVTDWGPYAGDRDLDLSQASAKEVGLNAVGADEVDVRVVASSVGYGSITSKRS